MSWRNGVFALFLESWRNGVFALFVALFLEVGPTRATLSCNDADPRTLDPCDTTTGACAHLSAPGCAGCKGAALCADSNPCTVEACDAATGQCLTASLPCADDGDPCTQELCAPDQGCVSNPMARCR